MRRVLMVCVSLLVAGSAIFADGDALNTLTAAERADGWKLLFAGKTTAEWRGFKNDGCPDGWNAVDGALTRVAEAGGIITVDKYADFDFTFDWRLAKKFNAMTRYGLEKTGVIALQDQGFEVAFRNMKIKVLE
jgi:hypothetical protein